MPPWELLSLVTGAHPLHEGQGINHLLSENTLRIARTLLSGNGVGLIKASPRGIRPFLKAVSCDDGVAARPGHGRRILLADAALDAIDPQAKQKMTGERSCPSTGLRLACQSAWVTNPAVC